VAFPRLAREDRATAGLAAVALLGAGAVLSDQFARMLARRSHEREREEAATTSTEQLIGAAAKDTVNVAVSGYAAASHSETVLFNLLAGFLGSFATVRLSTLGIRERRGPFRNLHVRGRHIHHFVPGILIAFGSGIAAVVSEGQEVEQRLAIPLGIGIGLTLDEAALLLDLRDVYWTREGVLSVQLSLGATAILSIAILTQRMLRRGEHRQEEEGLIPVA